MPLLTFQDRSMTLIFGDRVLCTDPSLMGHLVTLILTSKLAEKNFGKFFCWSMEFIPSWQGSWSHFRNQLARAKFIIQNGKKALERTLREHLVSCRVKNRWWQCCHRSRRGGGGTGCLLQRDEPLDMLAINPMAEFVWQGCTQFTARGNHIGACEPPNGWRWIKKWQKLKKN